MNERTIVIKDEEISMWEWLCARDVVEWLRPLWEGGGWHLCEDGKLRINMKRLMLDTPWVHHAHNCDNNCGYWNQILFTTVGLRMPRLFADGQVFVPAGCQDCWKVVVRPRTLLQLFALDDLQERLGRPAKCGIELRDTVPALYGGYFYHRSREEGEAGYDLIRKAVDEDPYLGPGVGAILKRGCTEMEHAAGPSDKWEVHDWQAVVEKLIDDFIVFEKIEAMLPEQVVWHTKRRWIEFAYANGDETYKRFSGGKALKPDYVTYHEVGKRSRPKPEPVTYNPERPPDTAAHIF